MSFTKLALIFLIIKSTGDKHEEQTLEMQL